MSDNEMTIGFIGNPNCGKTTLFNAYTGANLKVANWPGVTVEKVEGVMRDHDMTIHLVDLPGTYSLTSYTMEEMVSRQFILSGEVDVIINVVDASALERSLYLTLQLLELGRPVVMALNMMDIVEKRGMEIDLHRLPEMLGIPVIPVSARQRRGLDILLHAAIHHRGHEAPDRLIHEHRHASRHQHDHDEYAMVYSDVIEDKIDQLIPALMLRYPDMTNFRWHAIKLLEGDREITEKYPVDMPQVLDRSYESDIINQKYDFIGEIIDEVLLHKEQQDMLTERADRLLTSKVWGIPVFLGIMAVTFFLTFTVGDWLKGYLEIAIGWLSDGVTAALAAADAGDVVTSLVVDGIIGGVGTIVTFLPNILILFLCLALLEDSGYMARVAYVMEGIMSKLGLSGKAFIPMLLGFGCTVPAIMASRALESKRDRFKVMLVTPFMSCNARLTIYILFSEMFFPDNAMVVAYSMYLIGIVVAIAVSAVIHVIDRKNTANYLMIELPEYKLPDGRTVAISREGRNHHLPRHAHHLGPAQLRPRRLLLRHVRQLRRRARPAARALLRAHRPRLLADRRGAHSRHLGERGRRVELRRALRHSQRELRRGHVRLRRRARKHRLRPVQRLLPHGVLPAVHTLRRRARHHTQRGEQLGLDVVHRFLPARHGLARHLCGVPDRLGHTVLR